ncbi:PAK3 kinase, partial [Drymodes brunneopygia]|nr:PAK3 kinase [Drymodes brunneopygia]
SYLVGEDLWLVMEYMDGGTLQDVVRQTNLAEGEMAAVSCECLQAWNFLHSNLVIHRDLKSSSIQLGMDDSVKCSVHCQAWVSLIRHSVPGMWVSMMGTAHWMAPGSPYGSKVDSWSFGIVT